MGHVSSGLMRPIEIAPSVLPADFAKLGEEVAALEGASNRLIDVEALSEQDLKTLEGYYSELAELAGKHTNLAESHSVEEARERHSTKLRPRRTAR